VDVTAWLDQLGLGQYAQAFAENDVDAEALSRLTTDDLREIGVKSVGHRRKLLHAIAELSEQGAVARLVAQSAAGSLADEPPERFTPPYLAQRILASRAALAGERKQVTVLFADIKGSLELIEGADPEEASRLLDKVIRVMIDAVHRYEGTVNRVMGDGIMALFGAPIAHEDHAIRACCAALAMQDAMVGKAADIRRDIGIEVQVRVGLHSGEVVVRGIGNDLAMEYDAVGPTTHLAARMEQLALPGTVRLSADTARLAEGFIEARSLGPVPVKGLKAPVEVFELKGAAEGRSRFLVAIARGLSRFVGRHAELAALEHALDRAGEGHGQVFATIGEPGLGKSRLYYEFVHTPKVEGWLVVAAGSVSYGKATAYLPVVDLLKGYLRIESRDTPGNVREKVTGKLLTLDEGLRSILAAVLSLLGVPVDDPAWGDLDPSERRRRIIEAIRALLLRESKIQPLVVIFEDLHWIDAETQAVLDALVDCLPTARILLLVSYRPEFGHGWGGRSYYAQQRLEPLPLESAEALLSSLLGEDPVLDSLKRLLIERTEGNPFFVEESVRTLVEGGALTGPPGAYRLTQNVDTLEIPATVQGVLAARIDRLSAEDKRLSQTAAVVGKDVPLSLLQAVADGHEDQLNAGLTALQGAEFLYETRLFPEREYTFKHTLTHDVAYSSLLRQHRRDLHQRVADTIEALYAERRLEWADTLARHYEEAENWANAAVNYADASDKAKNRYANTSAFEFCSSALNCLNKATSLEEETQRSLLTRLFESRGQIRSLLGDNRGAADDFRALRKLAEAAGDRSAEAAALHRSAQLSVTDGAYDEGIADARQALTIARQINDRAAIARILITLGNIHINGIRGEDDAGVEFLEEAIPICRDLDDRAGLAEALCHLGHIRLLKGDYPNAIAFFRESADLARAVDDRPRLAFDLIFQGIVQMDLADFSAASDYLDDGITLAQEIEAHLLAAIGRTFLGWVEVKRAAYGKGQALLAKALATFEGAGAKSWIPLVLNIQGECLLHIGALEEAYDLFTRALPLAREVEDPCWQSFALTGLASIRGTQGRLAEAQEHYQESLKFCALSSDMWVRCRVEALAAWAKLLIARGDGGAALPFVDELHQRSSSMAMQQFVAISHHLRGNALVTSGKPEAAKQALQEALRLAQKLGDHALCRDSALSLGRIHTARGDTGSAREILAIAAQENALIARSLSDDSLRSVLEKTFSIEIA
jgi:class 3 adenylate cyclase/tetratricopeptide (TPR) repeat protein